VHKGISTDEAERELASCPGSLKEQHGCMIQLLAHKSDCDLAAPHEDMMMWVSCACDVQCKLEALQQLWLLNALLTETGSG